MTEDAASTDFLVLTTDIVSAHVANNSVHTKDLPTLIQTVHAALAGLGAVSAEDKQPEQPKGAVSVRKSLGSSDKIISMIDGKPYTTLKRHISKHGYDPKSYREAFGLPADYPMVAASYAAKRRELAHAIGLGRKAADKATAEVVKAAEAIAPKRRGRKPKTISEAIETAKEHLNG